MIDSEGIQMAEKAGSYVVPTMQMTQEDLHALQAGTLPWSSFEMDTCWMYRGGQNPLDWMKRLKERVVLLHQKDFPATCPQPMNLYEGGHRQKQEYRP